MLIVLAAVTRLTAYVCAVAAGVIWLARRTDPVLAAGLMALAFGVLAVAMLGMGLALGPRLMALFGEIGEPAPSRSTPDANQTGNGTRPDRPR